MASENAMTRRSFMKTASAAAAAAGVAGGGLSGCASGIAERADAAGAASDGETKEYMCACTGNCDNDCCQVWVTVRDGKVANIRKFVEDDDRSDVHHQQHNCLRCYDNIEREYSDQRIKTPLRRTGERGSGEFEEISWDEAIKEICDNFKKVAREYGPESVYFFYSSGFNNDKTVNYSRRLANLIGATVNGANLDMNGQFTLPQRIGKTTGIMRGDDYRRMRDAKNLFLWGTNPAESMMVSFNNITKAHENGAQLICIDPEYTVTAQHCDKWIPIRPGTDGLLAMAMLQIIMRDNKIDADYLRQKTVAPFLVKDSDGLFLRLSDLGQAEAGSDADKIVELQDGAVVTADEAVSGELEGSFNVQGTSVRTAYSLLRDRIDAIDLNDAAEKTDIDLDTIQWLADTYVDGPSWLQLGFGPDHYSNSYTFYETCIALAAAAGQMTKKGCGLTITDSELDCYGFNMDDISIVDGKNYTEVSGKIYNIWKNGGVPGKYEHPVRALYPIGANIVHNTTERGKTIEMMKDLDFVVTQDFEMTETCKWADIVLPVCFHFEREMMGVNGSEYLRYCERAIDPLFESKNDIDIWNLIAEGMGVADKMGNYSLEDLFEFGLEHGDAAKYGITLDKLKQNRLMHAYPEEIPMRGDEPFATATGRIEFYQENLKPQADWTEKEWDWRHETLPYWEPPMEAWPENDLHDKYPIVFITPHNRWRVHSMHSHVPTSLEIYSEPTMHMNDRDAADRGIEDGDKVRVYNDRGHVVVKVAVDPGVRPGTSVLGHGWDWDQQIDGHYQDLTNNDCADYACNNNYFDVLCQIEKA